MCTRTVCGLAIGLVMGWAAGISAQAQPEAHVLHEAEVVRRIVQRHPSLAAAEAVLARQQRLRGAAISLPQPELITEAPAGTFYTLGVNQRVDFPTVYARQRQVAEGLVRAAEVQVGLSRAALTYRARQAYLEAQYWAAQRALLLREDSLLQGFVAATELRYRLGQSRYLDQLNGSVRARLVRQQRDIAQVQADASRERLSALLGAPLQDGLDSLSRDVRSTRIDSSWAESNPARLLAQRLVELSQQSLRLERARVGPSLNLGYLNQGETPSNPVGMNFRIGLSVPLWWWEPRSRIGAARAQLAASEAERNATSLALTEQLIQLRADLTQAEQTLATFDAVALRQADELIRAAGESYRLGESNYLAYLTSLEQAFAIQRAYLDALRSQRQAHLALDLLAGRTDSDLN